jgi:hypothetical protein
MLTTKYSFRKGGGKKAATPTPKPAFKAFRQAGNTSIDTIDLSDMVKEMGQKLAAQSSADQVNSEFERYIAIVSCREYTRLGEEDGKKDVERVVTGRDNARAMLSIVMACLKQRVKNVAVIHQNTVQAYLQFAQQHSGSFSIFNCLLFYITGCFLITAEGIALYSAVGYLGIGKESAFIDPTRAIYALSICLCSLLIKHFWDYYIFRSDAKRADKLAALEKELEQKGNPQPVSARPLGWRNQILSALPVLVIFGLIVLYAVNVRNMSWVRADFMKAVYTLHVQSPEVSIESWNTRSATFIGFAFLFAMANGVFLAHGLYILDNRKQLRSLNKNFSIGEENSKIKDLIIKYEHLEDAISRQFVNSYNEGYNAAISERSKKTPLLMNIRQPFKKA